MICGDLRLLRAALSLGQHYSVVLAQSGSERGSTHTWKWERFAAGDNPCMLRRRTVVAARRDLGVSDARQCELERPEEVLDCLPWCGASHPKGGDYRASGRSMATRTTSGRSARLAYRPAFHRRMNVSPDNAQLCARAPIEQGEAFPSAQRPNLWETVSRGHVSHRERLYQKAWETAKSCLHLARLRFHRPGEE